jgi:hypothetical protein
MTRTQQNKVLKVIYYENLHQTRAICAAAQVTVEDLDELFEEQLLLFRIPAGHGEYKWFLSATGYAEARRLGG